MAARSKKDNQDDQASLPPIVGKVWRFVDYEARWGGNIVASEGKKIEVPKYVKWYVNAWKGCEGEFVSALNQLRVDPDFIWLQGALIELLSRATNTDRSYQGYLLTATHKPATAKDVGRILRTKGRGSPSRASAVLRKFREVGLLEQVELPASPSPQRKKDKQDKAKAGKRAPPKQKPASRPRKRGSRAAESQSPLKREGKSKVAAQQKKDRSAQESVQAQRIMCINQIKQMQSEGPATTAAAAKGGLAPTAAPSTSSTGSDEAGRVRETNSAGRIPAPSSIVRPIGEIIKIHAHRYDSESWKFADEVVIRCGYLLASDVARARRDQGEYTPDQNNERAHWAKAWYRAKGIFCADSLDWLRRGIFKRADDLRKSRHDKRNPQSYLMTSWNNLVKDLKRKGKAIG